MKFWKLSFFSFVFVSMGAGLLQAEQRLIIHAAEIGIGKFHRQDKKIHGADKNNIWDNYALPADADLSTPRVQNNENGSVTIFFSNLEELLVSAAEVSKTRGQKISVLNLNAHGMPSTMWFPEDEKTQKSSACSDWRTAAEGSDQGNYDQYYSPVARGDIIQLRILSKLPSLSFLASCTTGARAWKRVIARHPEVKQSFAEDAQLHLFSCVVGLGWAGRRFVSSLAATLFDGNGAKVQASMNFGLGDWSMPEGMGFWDYLNRAQLKHDNEIYPIARRDRDVMQKGAIRLAEKTNGKWKMAILSDLDFMSGNFDTLRFAQAKPIKAADALHALDVPESLSLSGLKIRIPGTAAFATVE